jgi:hypothetical protein
VVGGVAAPAVTSRIYETRKNAQKNKNPENWNPFGRPGNRIFVRGRSFDFLLPVREIVFAEQALFVEAQLAGDGADETPIENASGKFSPVFVFKRFEETSADARGRGYFGGRNFSHFALALQTFPKISPGHDVKPVPDDIRATARV